MAINEKLLKDALRVIKEQPTKWDQGSWGQLENVDDERLEPAVDDEFQVLPEGVTCGTSMCLAGHVVSLAGLRLLWTKDERYANDCFNPATGEVFDIMNKAQQLLGIDRELAVRIFSGVAALVPYDKMASEDYKEGETDDFNIFLHNLNHWTGVEFPEFEEDTQAK